MQRALLWEAGVKGSAAEEEISGQIQDVGPKKAVEGLRRVRRVAMLGAPATIGRTLACEIMSWEVRRKEERLKLILRERG